MPAKTAKKSEKAKSSSKPTKTASKTTKTANKPVETKTTNTTKKATEKKPTETKVEKNTPLRVAINGFGRIGRLAFRELYYNIIEGEENIEIVAINDLTDEKTLAYLLLFDTSQGPFLSKDDISYTDGYLVVDNRKIQVFKEKDPSKLPWKKLGIDLVIESTGFFTSKEKAQNHIKAGAKKVIVSAPSSDLKTIVYNVNHETLTQKDTLISAASCTTNCLAPVIKVLNDNFKINWGFMSTVHSVTNDQRILDLPHSDLRRGRSGLANIIPTTTGAAKAIGLVIPELNGKMNGIALRVPTISGSICDITVEVTKKVSKDDVNNAIKKAQNDTLFFCDEEIVSSDVIGSSFGSIFDGGFTSCYQNDKNKTIIKVLSWYDNENSYVCQMIRTLLHFIKI
ncbi:type I glyceraldehyde-3-phosphate dehydrogenase [symbiont of Argiope bruennichi]|uniref:type I glyceraldehyde-3-phosphate dehydrogenase n=1 Tax=symbiont of Argiope bruennichi TaxID=2810479 RepID=UPI003DA48956